MKLIDIGANLTHDSFDNDRDALIARATKAGVEQMIVTGSSAEVSASAARLAAAYPGILFATAGVHPHHAVEYGPDDEPVLRDLLELPQVVAVGECGLDYCRNFSPPVDQRRVFARQLAIAIECGKPVFLHLRDASEDFFAILREHIGHISRAVAHCFTGNGAELDACLDLGLYIGVTGWICDDRRGASLRECVGQIPLDRLMIETDAPYLLPRDLLPRPSTRRNEPMYLPHIAAAVARACAVDPEIIAEKTTRVAREFFVLPESG